MEIIRHLGYERVYLPLCKVADTPFHIQGVEFVRNSHLMMKEKNEMNRALGHLCAHIG